MTRKRLGLLVCIAALAIAAAPMAARASVIYQQSLANPPDAYASDWSSQQIADNFVLDPGASTITDIHWWGGYYGSTSPVTPDNFTILVWADNGGTPGSTVLNANVGNVNRTPIGETSNNVGIDLYSYSVNISPLALTDSTTYWISIINDTSSAPNTTWSWATSSGSGGLFRYPASATGPGGWYNGVSVAYQLTNDGVVPEPASLTLLGLGLAGFAGRKLRQRA